MYPHIPNRYLPYTTLNPVFIGAPMQPRRWPLFGGTSAATCLGIRSPAAPAARIKAQDPKHYRGLNSCQHSLVPCSSYSHLAPHTSNRPDHAIGNSGLYITQTRESDMLSNDLEGASLCIYVSSLYLHKYRAREADVYMCIYMYPHICIHLCTHSVYVYIHRCI